MWENIYLRNGTFLIISSDPASLPDPGWVMRDTPPEGRQHGPAGEDRWRVIRPEEAEEVLGRVAIKKGGASVGHIALLRDMMLPLIFCHKNQPSHPGSFEPSDRLC